MFVLIPSVATSFTPISALIGGVLIGIATVILMAANGRIAGISGIVGRLFQPLDEGPVMQSVMFVVGLLLAVPVYKFFTGGEIVQTVTDNTALLVIAGICVGVGTTVGSGCTSGHGVCGNSRLSTRSIVATLTFIATGVLSVTLLRHVIGG